MRLSHAKTFDIRFEHLRTFLALSDFGSFSVTGNQIGLSQSAVSRHIRALEDALGLRLFDRIGRRTVLTSSGKVLRTRLVALMREAETLPRLVKDLAEGVRGELRVGACVTAATSFLPMLLGHYRQKHPDVRLAMHPGSSAKAIEGLRRGDFDLAFIASAVVPPDVTVAATVRDEIVLVAAANHHLPKRQASPAELAECDFIQREPTSDTRVLATAWFESRGLTQRSAMEMWWPDTIKRLVGAGLGISALARRLVSAELGRSELRVIRAEGWPLKRKISVVTLQNAFVARTARRFLDLLKHQMRRDVA